MNDITKIIGGLEFTKAMTTFNPSTGEEIAPENLNELDKLTYDACMGAIALLKEQPEIVRCKYCKYYKDGFCYNPNTYDDEKTRGNTVPDWFCADGERS